MITDHLGKEYPSLKKMCEAYDIPMSTYNNRLLRGWTQEQALTITRKANSPKVNHKKIWKDHLGNSYTSVREMADAYGLSEKVFWSRKRILKWPLEKILTTPVQTTPKNSKKAVDDDGKEFESISALCRHHNIGLSTYRERRKRGWNVNDAINTKEKDIRVEQQECEDHLGNKYESLSAMCKHYHMSRYMYSSRIKMGWSKKDALTKPYTVNSMSCTDMDGHEFPTLKDLANYYALPFYAMQSISAGTLEPEKFNAILMTKIKSRLCNVPIAGLKIKKCVSWPYFLVNDHGHDCVLHYHTIFDTYHNSREFNPVPETNANKDMIRIAKQLTFPYYLAEIGDSAPEVYSYWELIRINTDSNFGLKKF